MSEQRKYGVAVAGLGYVGAEHVRAASQHPRARLVAVADPQPDRARQTAAEFGVMECAGFDALLQAPGVEIVIVAMPNEQHADHVVKALQARKHVLCEKPMATTEADCIRVVKAAQGCDRKVLVGHVARFSPLFRAVKEKCSNGALGQPFFAEGAYIHRSRRPLKPWWKDTSPGSFAVLGGGCHPIDLLRWTVGEVKEVVAASSSGHVLREYGLDDCVTAELLFENGCLGRLFVCLSAVRPYSIDVSIYGTRGTIMNNRVSMDGHEDEFSVIPVEYKKEHPYFAEELSDLIEAVEDDRQPKVSAEEGAQTVLVCLSIIASIRTGERVPVKRITSL